MQISTDITTLAVLLLSNIFCFVSSVFNLCTYAMPWMHVQFKKKSSGLSNNSKFLKALILYATVEI